MKNLNYLLPQKALNTFLLLFCSIALFAQAPGKFQYQTVIRDNNGDAVTTEITLRFSVHEETTDGTVVFQETQTATPNQFGLVSLQIGGGTAVVATLNAVNWGKNSHFLQVEMDDGSGYLDMGTSQMLSVPYALEAAHAATSDALQLTSPDGTKFTIDVDDGGNLTAFPLSGTFTDSRDGQEYNYVTIGNQVWMAENLAYLPEVVGPGTGSETTPYYYVYGYDGTDVAAAKAIDNYSTYGVLYNWPAAMAGATSSSTNPSGMQGICPAGWHLPSGAEWTELVTWLGNNGFSGTEGTALKSTSGWSSDGNGTDDFGFSALPDGSRVYNGNFNHIGFTGYWWSATEDNSNGAWYRNLAFYYTEFYRYRHSKDNGFSVRCVRD